MSSTTSSWAASTSVSASIHFGREQLCAHVCVVVTSFDVARGDIDLIDYLPWSCIFVDEVHRVKNPRSKLAAAFSRFTCPCRFGLSGTGACPFAYALLQGKARSYVRRHSHPEWLRRAVDGPELDEPGGRGHEKAVGELRREAPPRWAEQVFLGRGTCEGRGESSNPLSSPERCPDVASSWLRRCSPRSSCRSCSYGG